MFKVSIVLLEARQTVLLVLPVITANREQEITLRPRVLMERLELRHSLRALSNVQDVVSENIALWALLLRPRVLRDTFVRALEMASMPPFQIHKPVRKDRTIQALGSLYQAIV